MTRLSIETSRALRWDDLSVGPFVTVRQQLSVPTMFLGWENELQRCQRLSLRPRQFCARRPLITCALSTVDFRNAKRWQIERSMRVAIRRTSLGTGWRELDIGPGLVPRQPAQRNRPRQRSAVLVRRAAVIEEGAIDQFDENASVLDGLGRVGDLDQLAGGGVGISELARCDELHAAALSS